MATEKGWRRVTLWVGTTKFFHESGGGGGSRTQGKGFLEREREISFFFFVLKVYMQKST